MTSSPAQKGMTPNEIKEEVNNLKKVLREKQPSENVLEVLDRLEKGVQATADLLKTTNLGKLIGGLRHKANSPEISDAVATKAAGMVSKWKHDIGPRDAKTKAAATNGTGTPKKTVPSKSSSSQSLKKEEDKSRSNSPSISIKAVKPVVKKEERPPTPDSSDNSERKMAFERRTNVTDGVSFADMHKDSRARNKVVELMYNGLANKSSADSQKILDKAIECELEFYTRHGSDKGPYINQVRSLYQILGNASNPELRHQVLAGSISAHEFVNSNPELFLSAERQEEIRIMRKKNMDDAMVPQEVKAISNLIVCPKCKAKKTSYSQAQTRSADEPMTNFCECQACGNRWKFC